MRHDAPFQARLDHSASIGTSSDQRQDPAGFLHGVGKSTLAQGLTVPAAAQTQAMLAIPKGQARSVTIIFGDGESVEADLRRINSSRGPLQFRYESRRQGRLRAYLKSEYGQDPERSLLEVREVKPWVFRFMPVAVRSDRRPTLNLQSPVVSGVSAHDETPQAAISEVSSALHQVEYVPGCGQAEYNKLISAAFTANGWRREVRVLAELALRVDFEKMGIWVEVEFGNARTYYQDYVKLHLAHQFQNARCSMLLSPTQALACMLCELGAKRALAKRGAGARIPSYSGMMTHEKAVREFRFLRSIFVNPIVVAGLQFASPQVAV